MIKIVSLFFKYHKSTAKTILHRAFVVFDFVYDASKDANFKGPRAAAGAGLVGGAAEAALRGQKRGIRICRAQLSHLCRAVASKSRVLNEALFYFMRPITV